MSTTHIRLALDWTPNTLHTGFYVALQKGYYKTAGIELDILWPDPLDKLTPAQKLQVGEVQLAITAPEEIIANHLEKPSMVAVATILQGDPSAFVSLKSSGIDSLEKMDHKIYGEYGFPYETAVLKKIFQQVGGQGKFSSKNLPNLSIWEALKKGDIHLTWIFEAWEAVEAAHLGIPIHLFRLTDFDIPYCHTPILATSISWMAENEQVLSLFLKASAKAYQWAALHPTKAAHLLVEQAQHPSLKDIGFIEKSQQAISSYYLNQAGDWGTMEKERWLEYISWLRKTNIMHQASPYAFYLFVNDYLR